MFMAIGSDRLASALGDGFEGLASAAERLKHAGGGEMMDHARPFAALGDNADPLELVQMARQRGEAGGDEVAQVVDAMVAMAQRMEDQDASGMGEGLQNLGSSFGLFDVHEFIFAQLAKCVKTCEHGGLGLH